MISEKLYLFTKELEYSNIERCVCHIEERNDDQYYLDFPFTGELRLVKKHTLGWKMRRKLFREVRYDEIAYLMLKGLGTNG